MRVFFGGGAPRIRRWALAPPLSSCFLGDGGASRMRREAVVSADGVRAAVSLF